MGSDDGQTNRNLVVRSVRRPSLEPMPMMCWMERTDRILLLLPNNPVVNTTT